MTDIQLILLCIGIVVLCLLMYGVATWFDKIETEMWLEISEIKDRDMRRKIIKTIKDSR